jgi:hypothetical protein
MRRSLAVALLSVGVLAVGMPSAADVPADAKKFERSYALAGNRDIKIGIKVGDVTIDSFRVRHWPDGDDFRKAAKDLNDTHTVWVEFHYSNRDTDHDYKCKYTLAVPGKGKVLGENDRTATLDKGKIDDSNRLSLRMKTNDFKGGKTLKVTFEIWKK